MLARNRFSKPFKSALGSRHQLPSRASSLLLGAALLMPTLGLLAPGTLVVEGIVSARPARAQSASQNPEIKVGIIQRFGSKKDDKITLAPLAGDQLTVSFETNGQAQTLTTNQLQISITPEPLAAPELQEWVVLSTHRSFESAEDSANRWRAAGIEAEIAQPESWQVWAKRDIYSTPLVRRLLVENLHSEGYTGVFIDSKVVKEAPKATFIANGYKYVRDDFAITTANRRIQLAQGESTRYSDLYAGDLNIQPNAYGTYTLVNQVPIDLYLRGVVPHEIGGDAPRNAVEAQAILARTYALRNLRRFAIDDYELCADTQCQVYFGLAETNPTADSAIAATSGRVLTYENELVDALYSSTTGGITARFTDVWDGEDRPYLKPVVDALQPRWNLAQRPLSDEANFRAFIALSSGFNEDGWPAFRWNRSASLKEIGDTLKEYLSKRQHPLAGFTQITGLTVTERAASGRVQKVQVDTDIGSFDLVKDEAVKALVPPRSLLFYVEPIMEVPQASKSALSQAGKNLEGSNRQLAGTPELLAANLAQAQTEPGSELSAPAPATGQPVQNTGTPAPSNSPSPGNSPSATPVLTGYRFIGGGFGHGVGMSQTGAYNLARQGYSGEQILEFYFPGTELQPISESIVFWQAE